MQKVRLAVIGCGDVAQRDYLPEMHRIADRAEVVAIAGENSSRASEVASEFGIDRAFAGYRTLLDECECDAVLNLTPIQVHAEVTIAALESGRHVYSEKPLAASAAAATAVHQASLQAGRVLACAPSVTLYPQVGLVRSILEAGLIGQVSVAHARAFGGVPPWAGYASDPSPFFAVGGGPLIDMAVYPLHTLVHLLGPIRSVTAQARSVQSGFDVSDGPAVGRHVAVEVPDAWLLLVEHDSGVVSSVDANFVAHDSRAPELEVFGLDGTIAASLLDVGAPVETYTPDAGWRTLEVPGSGRSAGPDHLLGVKELVDSIVEDRAPSIDASSAIRVLAVIDAAVRSAASGHTERVAQPDA